MPQHRLLGAAAVFFLIDGGSKPLPYKWFAVL